MKFLSSIFICSIFLLSCNERPVNNPPKKSTTNKSVDVITLPPLSTYFETVDIKEDTVGNVLKVNIENSKLLENKKRQMSNTWVSPESWISVSATYKSKELNSGIDSLIYSAKVEGNLYRYAYSVKQLKKANNFFSICEQFRGYLNNNDYKNAINLLSANIIDKYSNVEIYTFLKQTFNMKPIDKLELIGTKIINDKYSLYINFWAGRAAQTYAFSFLENSKKIEGLQIAK